MARLILCMSLICIVHLLLHTTHARPPSGPTLVYNLMHLFCDQRSEGHHQFGFIVVGELADGALPTEVHLQPVDDITGLPWVDNSAPVSPVLNEDRVNYIVARPGDRYHAEGHLLYALDQLLGGSITPPGQSFILLYSWIFPCQHCVDDILYYAEWYSQYQWFVAYTTEGTLISGRTRLEIDAERNRNIERMEEAGIRVFHQPCQDLPSNLPESTHEHDELRRRRSADDGETCTNRNTFQGCLLGCLGDQVARCCVSGGSITMYAAGVAFVNSFTDQCFPSYTGECVNSFVQQYQHTVCSCIAVNAVILILRECLPQCMEYPLSRPFSLDTPSPPASVHIITNRSELRQRPEDIPRVTNCMTEGTTFRNPEFRSSRFLRRNRRATCMTSLECGFHNYWTAACWRYYTQRQQRYSGV